MDPATVVAIASFAVNLFGKSSNATGLIIQNQIRILQGLADIGNQLIKLSEALKRNEEAITKLPQASEIFETVAESRTKLSTLSDNYRSFDKAIAIGEQIDFAHKLSKIQSDSTGLIEHVTHIASMLESEDGNNSLLYSATTIDAALLNAIGHLLYPDLLFNYLKSKGAKLTNPDFDPKITIADLQTRYVDRLDGIYQRGESILSKQQSVCFAYLASFREVKFENPDKTLEWAAEVNRSLEAYVASVTKLNGGNSIHAPTSYLHLPNINNVLGIIDRFKYEAILRIVRHFDTSGVGGPSGRFITTYGFQQPISFKRSGDVVVENWSEHSGSANWKQPESEAITSMGISLWQPTFIDIDGGPNSAAVPPLEISGAAGKLEALRADFGNKKADEFALVKADITQNLAAVFYKSALRFSIRTRREELKLLRQ